MAGRAGVQRTRRKRQPVLTSTSSTTTPGRSSRRLIPPQSPPPPLDATRGSGLPPLSYCMYHFTIDQKDIEINSCISSLRPTKHEEKITNDKVMDHLTLLTSLSLTTSLTLPRFSCCSCSHSRVHPITARFNSLL